jgi:ATP-grasp domain, R2K clade family 2
MAKTLVLSPRFTPDSMALRDAAIELGWEVERLRTWRPTDELAGCDIVPYGEPLFAAVVADAMQLVLIEPSLSWIAELPFDLRRREIRFTNLRTARGLDRPAFIKPADDKCFQARVYGKGSELPEIETLGERNPVLVSEPVLWDGEFRCFVLEKRVAAISIYSRNGDLVETEHGNWPASPSELKDALTFASSVLQDARVIFPPAGVMDVGVIEGQGWAVVEANACWGAGIYGCDPRSVLQTLARACVRRAAVTDADRRWVIARPTALA